MSYELHLKYYKNTIEQSFGKYITTKNAHLKEALLYSLEAGGKRLRPTLLLEFCRMCGGDVTKALPYAVAVELIHTYSLIHDDLPCMDNDDFRRGKPTNHKVFGDAMAVLSGDSLLNLAFEIMSDAENAKHFKAQNVLRAISQISTASGASGMIDGQVLDILNTSDDITLDQLKEINLKKTGMLIKSACVAGAILADATDEQIKNAELFAINLGKAFQIKDDILDVVGNEEEIGKPIGSDADNNKKTYTGFYSIVECEQIVQHYTNKALISADQFNDNEIIKYIAGILVKRTK